MITFFKVKFGYDLRKWRKKHELSQADAGELFGVHASTVCGWEKTFSRGILMSNFLMACEWMEKDPRDYFGLAHHDLLSVDDNTPF